MNCIDTAVVVAGSANILFKKVIFYNNTGESAARRRFGLLVSSLEQSPLLCGQG